MGNSIALSSCFKINGTGSPVDDGKPSLQYGVTLVFWGGGTRTLSLSSTGEKIFAGQIMFEFPDRLLCLSNEFFIGRPIPVLEITDELVVGETYFVLPIDLFPCATLTAASLAHLLPGSSKGSPINFEGCAFQHVKGPDGRMVIKVSPEFITKAITGKSNNNCSAGVLSNGQLCNTPELKKHYEQLVGVSRDRPWSPKLETISEGAKARRRMSPARLLGLECVDVRAR